MWKKYCRGGQATDDNMAHTHCMLDNYTHSQCVILNAFPLQQWLHKFALMLRYTDIACPISVVFLLLQRSHYKFSFHFFFTELLKTFAVIHTKHVFLISRVSIAIVVLLCSFDVIFSRHDFSSGRVCCPI